MNASDLLFRTDRFNLSKVGENFINPCCFGEDLAAWLKGKLCERGVEVREPYQEDWGWELPIRNGKNSYCLCMSGNADKSVTNPNEGEWRIIVAKRRSLWQRLTGKGQITQDDAMLVLVGEILRTDPRIRNVHIENV